ncbi:CDP-diacylglycerol--glycerol-3-phosphate 3-phosphatidyltransferase [Tessaracoccus antarcticus]|uniref:CDP-diacylglycerol--glycerol-3-phosphate 3-phosphatidyltransferase n=1 Tax=Tessaracoccus antarcticus TaxID=2479848 RepID=A0A3M0G917_9ACTN|nr:CDP-diacylglycerol--glycerol-3-phosphate 3-phosphatidyltransferase [Tessaracoccus antarcticus]RMB58932.1 CDP-diacylglycerol--glycerol-3-phosphate 3-phosphatidyltransferase [Tessaracoccus antarcticus]
MTAEARPSNLNVPNALTVLRIILVPVFLVVLFTHPENPGWRVAATAVFVVAILTDLADGHIARKYNLVTDFGKLWDPVADKALTGAAFVSLGILGELNWVIIVLILVREWGITWLRAAIAKYGIMAANRGGKLKTVTQSVALAIYLLGLENLPVWLQVIAQVIMWAALVLTLLTGADYIRSALKIRRDAIAAGTRRK